MTLTGSTVLVLHAHPDDEAIFTGVTIRRLADAGARVVLVTATLGELGEAHLALAPGETMAQRRVTELEHAAELLGVSRLVLLGKRDSGLPGAADNVHPDALAASDPAPIVRRVAELIEQEQAEAVVYDDGSGIYGHPDHLAAHRVGAAAAAAVGVPGYQSTVDRDHLSDTVSRAHLVHAAAAATGLPFGVPADEVALKVTATAAELSVKQAAMAAHASQIAPGAISPAGFDETYGFEWFLRDGPPGLLDQLGQLSVELAAS